MTYKFNRDVIYFFQEGHRRLAVFRLGVLTGSLLTRL